MFEWLITHKKNIMKYTLYLVIPSFVLLYGYGECAAPQQYRWAVKVNTVEVPEYSWQRQMDQIRANYQQYGMPAPETEELRRQALQSVIVQELLRQKADEWGVAATDQEVARSIREEPAFHDENGNFNMELYKQAVAQVGSHPVIFEMMQRENLTRNKVQAVAQFAYGESTTDTALVSKRRNSKATIEYLQFDPNNYTDLVEVNEDDLVKFFEENKEDYRVPEQRSVAYAHFLPSEFAQSISDLVSNATSYDRLLQRYFEQNQQNYEISDKVRLDVLTYTPSAFTGQVDVTDEEAMAYFEGNTSKYRNEEEITVRYIKKPMEEIASTVEISDEEIEKYYNDHPDSWTHGEQSRARHILIRFPAGATDEQKEEVKERILNIRKEIEEGLSFAEAAKRYSEDVGSGARGGDLGFYERGIMVPPFDKAMFELPLGQMSEPVETQFGYHLILVEARKEAGTDTLEQAREEIRETLGKQKGIEEFRQLAEEIKSLDELKDQYEIHTTGWFSRGAEIGGIPQADRPYFSSNAFVNLPGRPVNFSGNSFSENLYLIENAGRREARPMTFEEAKSKVVQDVKTEKAGAIAAQAAQADIARIQEASVTLEVIAAERGLEVQTSPLFGRDDNFVPGLGSNLTEITSSAMTMELGEIDGPFETQSGQHIVRLLTREPAHLPELLEVRGKVDSDFRAKQLQDRARIAANILSDQIRVSGKSLEEEAQAEGREVQTSQLFSQGGQIPGLGFKSNVNRAAFELEEIGAISDAIEETAGFSMPGQQAGVEGYYVLQLLEIKEPYLPELDEVREDVEKDFKFVLAGAIAEQKANEVLESVKQAAAGATPVHATQTLELSTFADDDDVSDTGTNAKHAGPVEITGAGQLTGVGRAIPVAKTALNLEPGKISAPIKTYQQKQDENNRPVQGPMSGVFIIQVLGKGEEDAADENAMQNQITRYMEQQAQRQVYASWIDEVSATANIEYNQDIFAPIEDDEGMTESS